MITLLSVTTCFGLNKLWCTKFAISCYFNPCTCKCVLLNHVDLCLGIDLHLPGVLVVSNGWLYEFCMSNVMVFYLTHHTCVDVAIAKYNLSSNLAW